MAHLIIDVQVQGLGISLGDRDKLLKATDELAKRRRCKTCLRGPLRSVSRSTVVPSRRPINRATAVPLFRPFRALNRDGSRERSIHDLFLVDRLFFDRQHAEVSGHAHRPKISVYSVERCMDVSC